MVRISSTSLENEDKVDVVDVIGKKVLSRDGKSIGSVDSINIHPKTLTLVSVSVSRGFLAPEYEIGREYIDVVNEDGVLLKIFPSDELKNKEVYDSYGRKIGNVKTVQKEGETNEVVFLIVDTGLGKSDKEVRREHIKEIGQNIVLNVPRDEL